MKKLTMIVFAGVVLLACNKRLAIPDPQENVNEPGTYIFTLKASVADDLTKTSYADEKTFSWSANDEISVVFHKVGEVVGDDIIFVDLKTTVGGTTADFSGTVPNGYEIGASDTEGGVKWALFPAGAHTWNTTNHRPNFVIPEVTDFTTPGAHFSTNIPMYAEGDGENNFTFNHIACAYKFTFSNLDATKVRLKVTHNTTHKLSGSFPLNANGKWYAQYASLGSANQSVSYITNVSAKTAVFYFCIGKDSESSFQPTITLYDETTGNILYRATAKAVWGGNDALKPLYDRMVILPSIPAPGTGTPFISQFNINWGSQGVSADGEDAFRTIKAFADEDYLYLYLDIVKSDLTLSGYYHKIRFYLSDGSDGGTNSDWIQKYSWTSTNDYDWLVKGGTVQLDTFDGLQKMIVDKNIVTHDINDAVYLELKIDRTVPVENGVDSGYAVLSPAATYLAGASVYVAVDVDDMDGSTWTSTGLIGHAPASGENMLLVTLP